MVGWLAVRGFGALNGVKYFRTMWLWIFFSGINLLGTWRVNFWCILGFVGMGEGVRGNLMKWRRSWDSFGSD